MPSALSTRPTLGFISTWPIYQGTTIDRHAHALIQGICAASRDLRCHLLLGCGISARVDRGQWRTVWPVPGPDTDFVPVGPWNTDGLIIVPDDLSEAQSRYVQDLQASGFPVIFTTLEGSGPVVTVDNANGIRQAVLHLLNHGHRRIAFIAGKSHRGGDSAERLKAYGDALRDAGLNENPHLIAYGEHRYDGGQEAMRQILSTGAPFTAFVASNDLSCLGAIDTLSQAGLRVPDDVAAIGFDDILDARSHTPSLTTVRHPTFALGYQAVITLMDRICGQQPSPSPVVVPTRLILRQSCGCKPESLELASAPSLEASGPEQQLLALARLMAEAAFTESRHSTLDKLEEQCRSVVQALSANIIRKDEKTLRAEIAQMLERTKARGEDAHVWQAAISALYRRSNALLDLAPDTSQAWIMGLLDQARLEISEHVQRQTTHALLEHMDMMSQLGLLTSQLLAALDVSQSAEILTYHLPRLGIEHALVALYHAEDEDAVSQSQIALCIGLPQSDIGRRFDSRRFPLWDLYPADSPLQLMMLPLSVDERTSGFVAFSATNLEPAAAIVRNLATAIRTSRLYREALEGRRLAEEANQLKSRFLSMVSHELRTPLSFVVGLSEMVLRESREGGILSSAAVRDLEQILASAQHLGRLIGDVLDLASSEAGQLRLVRQPLDLSEVLLAVALTGEQMAREKGLDWHARIPSPGLWVQGDRTRLRQVVLNLISNAVKFTDRGSVTVEVACTDGDVTVSVSDTGIGIPADEQALIFNEFHRSERVIRQGYGGLGLGLAICKQLVRHHGGTIGVRSPGPEGRGSTFYFTLPTLAAIAPTKVLADETSSVVLLTEQAEAHAWLEDHLRERGFAVQVHRVDWEADWFPRLLESPPAAVILDDALAARQGWEITRMFKSRAGLEHIPMLVYRLDPDQDQGELLELNYLLKPLQADQLAQELTRQGLLTPGLTAKQTILIVDDDPDIVALHTRLVQQAGGRALPARNGREALAVIGQTRPDLVLLDLIMPEMDGFQVLDAMRAKAATRDIPVIVVTGQTLTDADIDRLNRGVATILSKGIFTAQETLARIEASLSRRRALGSATQRLVRRAMAYIHAHYAEPISREEIAQHVAISADYLTDCFHQELGVTPITYLTRYRIQQAKELLDSTDKSITEIALTVGFSEVSHFTRTFHREVGVSPRAYRRGQRRQHETILVQSAPRK